jgi:hypothetical protein
MKKNGLNLIIGINNIGPNKTKQNLISYNTSVQQARSKGEMGEQL